MRGGACFAWPRCRRHDSIAPRRNTSFPAVKATHCACAAVRKANSFLRSERTRTPGRSHSRAAVARGAIMSGGPIERMCDLWIRSLSPANAEVVWGNSGPGLLDTTSLSGFSSQLSGILCPVSNSRLSLPNGWFTSKRYLESSSLLVPLGTSSRIVLASLDVP